MTRLPRPGDDIGTWGDILNAYLLSGHNSDGTHNPGRILNVPAAHDFILASNPASSEGVAWLAKHTLQGEDGREVELRATTTAIEWRYVGSPAWTELITFEDLLAASSGSEAPAWAVPSGGMAAQILRKESNADYDLGWASLSKADVGLGQADNTADADKPLSLAAQAALNAKANKAGDTFTGAVTVQNSANSLDMHVINTANDATLSVRTQGAAKAAYINLYSISGVYMAIAGWVNNAVKWRIGRFGGTNGVGVWVHDGATQAVSFADDKTTRLYGGLITPIVTKNANYTLTTADHTVLADTSLSPLTITLPTAVGAAGRQFVIKDWKGQALARNITVATTSSQTIDGGALHLLNANYATCTVVSDGANWVAV